MKKITKIVATSAILSMVLGFSGCGNSSAAPSESPSSDTSSAAPSASGAASASAASAVQGKDYTITLITMDQIDEHWQKVNAGCKKAIDELKAKGYNITYNWNAPATKDNAQQIAQIEMAINNGANAIIIAVNDATACNKALQDAKDAGIKIVYVDSPATIPAEATFSTDNKAAGEQAGQFLLKTLTDAGVTSGDIGIIGAQSGVQSCVDRENGFRGVFDGKGYKLLETQFSDGDVSKAQELATNEVNNGVVALYGVNEAAAAGAGNAAKDSTTKVYAVGFDASPAVCSLIEGGSLQAAMAQNPGDMGYDGMNAAVQVLDGADLKGAVTDTGATVVTKDNVKDFEK